MSPKSTHARFGARSVRQNGQHRAQPSTQLAQKQGHLGRRLMMPGARSSQGARSTHTPRSLTGSESLAEGRDSQPRRSRQSKPIARRELVNWRLLPLKPQRIENIRPRNRSSSNSDAIPHPDAGAPPIHPSDLQYIASRR